MVDIPGNDTTTTNIGIGGSVTDELEIGLDTDWIRVTFVAGATYQISLTSPIFDTYLSLYDSAGGFLSEDDDGGGGFNSLLEYTATVSGVFYIEAAGFALDDFGAYTVDVDAFLPQPAPTPLESIDWGTQVADLNVTVYFAAAGETFDGVTSEGWNAYEISRFQAAFDFIEAVSGLTFTIQSTPAEFNLVLDLDENGGEYLGYFNPPGEVNEGVGVFSGQLWDRAAGGDLDTGGYGFVTITHELLHGLGFAHPHDNGGTSAIMDGVESEFDDYGTYLLNQGIFTTMSYNSGYFTGTPGSQPDASNTFSYEAGPMALDIALLQQNYGANTTTNAGSTQYILDTVNAIGTYWQAIWDVSGASDEIINNGTVGSTIDLRAATLTNSIGGGGFVSAVDGIAGGFTIANNVVIERATGGTVGDTLIGNSAANRLDGRGGADTMLGGAGDDFFLVDVAGDVVTELVGEGTADRVLTSASYTLAAAAHIELFTTALSTATTAINLTGNAFAQAITGNAGLNSLSDGGGAGVDTLTGLAGNDTYIVRNAATVIIEGAGQGTADRVAANLSFALAADDNIEIMTTTSSGGTSAISLTGNALVQSITGNAGANVLRTGGGAADTLAGLGGNDTYRVFNALDVIVETAGQGTADRVTAAVSFALAADDHIEIMTTTSSTATTAINLTGNALAQAITGNAGLNSLSDGGGAGADTLTGLAGNDTYIVRNSATLIVEGAGQGTADRVAAGVSFVLAADDNIEVLTTNSSAGITAISLAGNALAQAITGNAGINVLNGLGGLDTLTGGGGADAFVFSTALGAGNIDTITDFNVIADTIRLENAIFTGLVAGVLTAAAFRANLTGLAADASDRIIHETDTGNLFFDVDGLGGAAGLRFAVLGAGLAVTQADFLVI